LERIISTVLSLTVIILALSTIIPALFMYSGGRMESGLNKCITILSRAAEENLSIDIVSKWEGGAVLLINDSYEIKMYVEGGELICIVEASPT